jgi:L-lysine exporter family protein LysE/ArgO
MPASFFAFSTGLGLCLSLIIAIGAQNAFLLRQGLRREHVGAIVLFCALSDALLIAAGVAGLAQLLGERPAMATALTVVGAVFLLVYGALALKRARHPAALNASAGSQSLKLWPAIAQTAAFTFLNPHVYLDTVLLMGSIGAQQGVQRWWFVAGAACASALWFTALGYGARWLAPWFAKPRAWQILDALIGLTMLGLALMLVMRLV